MGMRARDFEDDRGGKSEEAGLFGRDWVAGRGIFCAADDFEMWARRRRLQEEILAGFGGDEGWRFERGRCG